MTDETTIGRPVPDYGPQGDQTNIGVITGSPSRVSWGAIFAGTISGLAIYLVLGLMGLAAGIGAIDPAEEANPVSGVPYGLGVWWVISALVAFFIGGVIAGRLAGFPRSTTGALHGLTVGSLTLLLVAWLATTTAGSAISGAAGAIAQIFDGADTRNVRITVAQPLQRIAAQAVQQPAGQQQQGQQAATGQQGGGEAEQQFQLATEFQNQVTRAIRQEAASLLRAFLSPEEQRRVRQQAVATYRDLIRTPGDAGRDVQQLFDFLLSNRGVLGEQDQQEAKRILIDRLGVPEQDADLIISRWTERYQQAVQELQQLVNDAQSQLRQFLPAEVAGAEAQGQAGTGQGAGAEGQGSAVLSAVRPVANEEEVERTREIIQSTYSDIMNSPSGALSEIRVAFDELFGQGDVWSTEDLQELRTLIGERTGLTEEQVDQLIQRWQSRYQQAVQRVNQAVEDVQREAIQATDRTLDYVASATGWTSFALVLALGSAVVGGLLGSPDENRQVFAARDIMNRWRRRNERDLDEDDD